MTPSRFTELNDRLIAIEQRLLTLANIVQGTVPETAREVREVNSTCDAFSQLCHTTTNIGDELCRLETALLDKEPVNEGRG